MRTAFVVMALFFFSFVAGRTVGANGSLWVKSPSLSTIQSPLQCPPCNMVSSCEHNGGTYHLGDDTCQVGGCVGTEGASIGTMTVSGGIK